MDENIGVANSTNFFPELTTRRRLLREFRLEDFLAVFDILGREQVNAWLETDTM